MGFSFDSRLGFCAALLCATAALAWRLAASRRAGVRLNLRFAAILWAALGVEGLAAALTPSFLGVAFAIALMVPGLAGTALTLSLFAPRPAPALLASVALAAELAAGLASVLSGQDWFAVCAQALSVSVMILIGLARLSVSRIAAAEILAGAFALLGGGMALVEGALAGALSLFAAGLLGLACASQTRVEQQAGVAFGIAIGRPRL